MCLDRVTYLLGLFVSDVLGSDRATLPFGREILRDLFSVSVCVLESRSEHI